MATIQVRFKRFLINDMAIRMDNADEDHLFSSVAFDLIAADGQVYEDLKIPAILPYQGSYDQDPFEFWDPELGDYPGPFPKDAFLDLVRVYCRSVMGPLGSLVMFGRGANNLVFQNFALGQVTGLITLEVPDVSGRTGAWEMDKLKPEGSHPAPPAEGQVLGRSGPNEQQQPQPQESEERLQRENEA